MVVMVVGIEVYLQDFLIISVQLATTIGSEAAAV
jgi:hypothetical protein